MIYVTIIISNSCKISSLKNNHKKKESKIALLVLLYEKSIYPLPLPAQQGLNGSSSLTPLLS